MEERLEAFKAARALVDPIVEHHGLEPVKGSAPAFTVAPTFTKVEQHLDSVIRVADWLLGDS